LPGLELGWALVADLEVSLSERVREIVAAHRGERGALMPILHAIQAEYGHIDPASIPVIAEELNLSRADVHGVVTFYKDFKQESPGRTTVRVCRAEACQAVGSDALAERVQSRLGVGFGETTADGTVSLEAVFCLGNCALGPSVEIGRRLYGRMDADRLDALLSADR
jgi:formate dehydrogenase subunit gamma